MFEWTNRNKNLSTPKKDHPQLFHDWKCFIYTMDYSKKAIFYTSAKQILREFELPLFWSSFGVQNHLMVTWWFGIRIGMPFSNNPLSFSGILSDSQTTNPPKPPTSTIRWQKKGVTCSSRSGTWIDGWRGNIKWVNLLFPNPEFVQGIFVRDTSLNQKTPPFMGWINHRKVSWVAVSVATRMFL